VIPWTMVKEGVAMVALFFTLWLWSVIGSAVLGG
jgi:hypothetical protein